MGCLPRDCRINPAGMGRDDGPARDLTGTRAWHAPPLGTGAIKPAMSADRSLANRHLPVQISGMTPVFFLFPATDFKTVKVAARSELPFISDQVVLVLGIALLVGFLLLLPRRRGIGRRSGRPARRKSARPARRQTARRGKRPPAPWGRSGKQGNWVLIDGSNVMHWLDNTPQLAPVLQVLAMLKAEGLAPRIVFDANAGYDLFGKYLNGSDFARILSLPHDQVLVVPKGTQADGFLLASARNLKVRIVTNDRYRDWAEMHPEVNTPDFLIPGGMQDGKVWLTGREPTRGVSAQPSPSPAV